MQVSAEDLATLLNQIYAPSLNCNIDLEKKNELFDKLAALEQEILSEWLKAQGWQFSEETRLWTRKEE